MFLSHTKEMFKKMNHIHPIGKNEGLVDDLGAEVSKFSRKWFPWYQPVTVWFVKAKPKIWRSWCKNKILRAPRSKLKLSRKL